MRVMHAEPNRSKQRESLQQRDSKSQKSMKVTTLPPSMLTSEDIVRLMRKHRITIPILAVKVGSSQRRVRLLRHTGLTDAAVIRDWLEAITGQDPGPVPKRCKIENEYEGAECHCCGYPLFHGDVVWRYADHAYCTIDCVRKNLSK